MKINTDRIVSLSAMVVGVSSLMLALYQTHLMRQAQTAGAMPYLMISMTSNGEGVYMNLRNTGVGPALIDGVRVIYQGRAIPSDPYDFLVALKPDRKNSPLAVDRVLPGRLIPAGEGMRILGMDAQHRIEMLDDLLRVFEMADVPRTWLTNSGIPLDASGRAVVEVDYRSVYGDRWRARSDRTAPVAQ